MLSEDGGMVLIGHNYDLTNSGCAPSTGCTRIRGSIIKVDDMYNKQWKKLHGNYPGGTNQFAGLTEGPWSQIYTECWGATPMYSEEGMTGYIMSCGEGIEDCGAEHITSVWTEDLKKTCDSDPRVNWRSLTIAVDLEGNRIWSR